MRIGKIIERYRRFALRGHVFMGLLALALVTAIIVLMIVSAIPSEASFLLAESGNLATIGSAGDLWLIVIAGIFFAGSAAVLVFARARPDR
jgi:hypothetical protein